MRFPFTRERQKSEVSFPSRLIAREPEIDDFKFSVIDFKSLGINENTASTNPPGPDAEFEVFHILYSSYLCESTEATRNTIIEKMSMEIKATHAKRVYLSGTHLPGTIRKLADKFPSVKFCYFPIFSFSEPDGEFYVTPQNGMTEEEIRSDYPNMNFTIFNKDVRLLEVIALLLEYEEAICIGGKIEAANFFKTSVIFRNIRPEIFKSISEDVEGIEDFDCRKNIEHFRNVAGLMNQLSRRKISGDLFDIINNEVENGRE